MHPSEFDNPPCAEIGTDLFFPERGDPMVPRFLKKMCSECPFHQPCFEYAFAHSVQGHWAATSESFRAELRTKHGIVPIPLTADDDDDIPDKNPWRVTEEVA